MYTVSAKRKGRFDVAVILQILISFNSATFYRVYATGIIVHTPEIPICSSVAVAKFKLR